MAGLALGWWRGLSWKRQRYLFTWGRREGILMLDWPAHIYPSGLQAFSSPWLAIPYFFENCLSWKSCLKQRHTLSWGIWYPMKVQLHPSNPDSSEGHLSPRAIFRVDWDLVVTALQPVFSLCPILITPLPPSVLFQRAPPGELFEC